VAALDHLNIVRAYDVDKETDKDNIVHFLVMEYVDGKSLQHLVEKNGPLPPATAANVIRQAADGLAHAHAAGMVHRDVKPGNLLIDGAGVVKILDLGVARFFDDRDGPTPAESGAEFVGTADYLAPEQALDSTSADPRADIYSLGCTLYFLLAGHPPFPEGTLSQRLIGHQTEEPKPIEEINPNVPASLAVILRGMMAKKREERVQSATEVSQAMGRWLQEHAGDARKSRRTAQPGSAPPARPTPPPPSAARAAPPEQAQPAADREHARTRRATDSSGSTASQDFLPRGVRRDNQRMIVLLVAGGAALCILLYGIVYLTTGRSGRSQAVKRASEPESVATAAAQSKEPERDDRDNAKTGPKTQDDANAAAKNPGDKLSGDITVGPQGDFKTIGEALAHVRRQFLPVSRGTRRTIRVKGGETYAERIVIDNTDLSFPNGVQLICEGEPKAILAPAGTEPIVKLTGPSKAAELFTLEGFELRAEGKPVAIELAGYLVSTRLARLEVTGFSQCGLLGKGASGLGVAGREFVIDRVTFRGTAEATGVKLLPGTFPSSHLRIINGRFFGPMKEGVSFRDEAINVVVRDTVFSQTGIGLAFEGIGSRWRDVIVENNSFFHNDRGIVFRAAPDGTSGGLAFRRNLFIDLDGVECAHEGTYDERKFLALMAGGGILNNWSNRAAGSTPANPHGAEVDLFQQSGQRGAEFRFLSTDPAHADFLKPAPDAPHKGAGAIH